jgi:competence ComEA-like helix-hairpin-helix protein
MTAMLRGLLATALLLLAGVEWADALVDPNSATVEELTGLPGLGPLKAKSIVADREANGPFESVESLDRVKGIGPALLEKLRPHLAVTAVRREERRVSSPPRVQKDEEAGVGHRSAGSMRPVLKLPPALEKEPPAGKLNLNFATAEELQQLDGVTEQHAAVILERRLRKGPYRSLAELGRVPGLTQKLLATLPYFVTVKLDAADAGENALVASGVSREGAREFVALRDKQRGKVAKRDLTRLAVGADDKARLGELLWFP